MAENGVFYLGLTMAGGISAGAYSAGVFDFLIQALEEWERAKQADRQRPLKDREVPNHAVVIPVISGASAGGITGALGILSAADHFDMPEPAQAAATRAVLPALYETWVQSISFTPKNGRPSHLLDVSDLERGPIRSLLDGTAIFDAAEAAIFKARDARQERAYFAKTLHLFLATTNLRGVPYRILYTGGDDPTEGHVMMLHGDRIHYEFQGVGTNTFTSPWLKGYGEKGIPISPPQFQRRRSATLSWKRRCAQAPCLSVCPRAWSKGKPQTLRRVPGRTVWTRRFRTSSPTGRPAATGRATTSLAMPDRTAASSTTSRSSLRAGR